MQAFKIDAVTSVPSFDLLTIALSLFFFFNENLDYSEDSLLYCLIDFLLVLQGECVYGLQQVTWAGRMTTFLTNV